MWVDRVWVNRVVNRVWLIGCINCRSTVGRIRRNRYSPKRER